MAVREKILEYLKDHPEGVDDDQLASALNLSQRQQANQACRALAAQGLVRRDAVNGKIRNFVSVPGGVSPIAAPAVSSSTNTSDLSAPAPDDLWCWEGNVQASVVSYLAAIGYRIIRVADTTSREQGVDIIARSRAGAELRVSVKGYPTGTGQTSPPTQARHYFTDAIYDLVAWRNSDEHAEIALGLPDVATYRNMAKRVAWLLRTARADIYWVSENGGVELQPGAPA